MLIGEPCSSHGCAVDYRLIGRTNLYARLSYWDSDSGEVRFLGLALSGNLRRFRSAHQGSFGLNYLAINRFPYAAHFASLFTAAFRALVGQEENFGNLLYALVAQLVEQYPFKVLVESSNLSQGTKEKMWLVLLKKLHKQTKKHPGQTP